MIAPAKFPSNKMHGHPLEPLQSEALTPKIAALMPASARSTVPGATLFNPGLVMSSRLIWGSYRVINVHSVPLPDR